MSIPVISISINEGDQTLIAKNLFQFTVNIQPTDATNQTLNWNSSNPYAATIDLSGNLMGITDGLTVITASLLDDPTI